jgi:hypothetical protein
MMKHCMGILRITIIQELSYQLTILYTRKALEENHNQCVAVYSILDRWVDIVR